jgi:hypothetical protein
MTNTIQIDAAKLQRLKSAHKKALDEGKGRDAVVTVDGDEFVVAYLGYLIEYAESRLSSERKPG